MTRTLSLNPQKNEPTAPKKVLILTHGLNSSRKKTFKQLEKALGHKYDKIISLDYKSRAGLSKIVDKTKNQLTDALKDIDLENTSFDVMNHSMGAAAWGLMSKDGLPQINGKEMKIDKFLTFAPAWNGCSLGDKFGFNAKIYQDQHKEYRKKIRWKKFRFLEKTVRRLTTLFTPPMKDLMSKESITSSLETKAFVQNLRSKGTDVGMILGNKDKIVRPEESTGVGTKKEIFDLFSENQLISPKQQFLDKDKLLLTKEKLEEQGGFSIYKGEGNHKTILKKKDSVNRVGYFLEHGKFPEIEEGEGDEKDVSYV